MNLGEFMRLASLAGINRPIQQVLPIKEIHTTEVREIRTVVDVPTTPKVEAPVALKAVEIPNPFYPKRNSFKAENPGYYIDSESEFSFQWETLIVESQGVSTTRFTWRFPHPFKESCVIAWAVPANCVGSFASIGHGLETGPFWDKEEAHGGVSTAQPFSMLVSCFAIGK